jgi:hypothetical protein
VSRRVKQLLLITFLLVGGLTLRNIMWEPPPVPGVPEPRTGLSCFRQGGDHDYCSCLDRLDSARAATGQPTPELPPVDHPVIRYALRHPRLYPIINADTLRCMTPPRPPTPGVHAGTTGGLVARA